MIARLGEVLFRLPRPCMRLVRHQKVLEAHCALHFTVRSCLCGFNVVFATCLVNMRSHFSTSEQTRCLASVIEGVRKEYGNRSLVRLGDMKCDQEPADVISTGIFALDQALGIGGLPRGHLVELCGRDDADVTAMALYMMGRAQGEGGTAVLVNHHIALDLEHLLALKVDVENLYIGQPNTWEEALEMGTRLVASRVVDCVVMDGTLAPYPTRRLQMTGAQKLPTAMSQWVRLNQALSRSRCLLLWLGRAHGMPDLRDAREAREEGRTEVWASFPSLRLRCEEIDPLDRGEWSGRAGRKRGGVSCRSSEDDHSLFRKRRGQPRYIRVGVVRNMLATPSGAVEVDLVNGTEHDRSGATKEGERVKEQGGALAADGQAGTTMVAPLQGREDNPSISEHVDRGKEQAEIEEPLRRASIHVPAWTSGGGGGGGDGVDLDIDYLTGEIGNAQAEAALTGSDAGRGKREGGTG